jgi:hypothetical protein
MRSVCVAHGVITHILEKEMEGALLELSRWSENTSLTTFATSLASVALNGNPFIGFTDSIPIVFTKKHLLSVPFKSEGNSSSDRPLESLRFAG